MLRLASHATNEPGDSPLVILPGKTKLRCLDKSSSQLILLIIVKHNRAYFFVLFSIFIFIFIHYLLISFFIFPPSWFSFHISRPRYHGCHTQSYRIQSSNSSTANLRCPLFISVTFANKIIWRRQFGIYRGNNLLFLFAQLLRLF